MAIEAKIIADSKNEFGQRITSFLLRFPRIVLAEFNTHRMLSRNSASSRAIPFQKMLKMVQEDPFIPIAWMKEHTGMQGSEYFTDSDVCRDYNETTQRHGLHDERVEDLLKRQWLSARDLAVQKAELLSYIGLTKQLCNRLLECFMWHTVLVTATEWTNFFALRAHPDAEIHIQALAYKMMEAYNQSVPKLLKAGEWHVPFGDDIDTLKLSSVLQELHGGVMLTNHDKYVEQAKLEVATARCARTSYTTFDTQLKHDYAADIKLHDKLANMGHWSPFEHCAKAMTLQEMDTYTYTEPSNSEDFDGYVTRGVCGNFRGFIQYRKLFPGENKTDDRVIKQA